MTQDSVSLHRFHAHLSSPLGNLLVEDFLDSEELHVSISDLLHKIRNPAPTIPKKLLVMVALLYAREGCFL